MPLVVLYVVMEELVVHRQESVVNTRPQQPIRVLSHAEFLAQQNVTLAQVKTIIQYLQHLQLILAPLPAEFLDHLNVLSAEME